MKSVLLYKSLIIYLVYVLFILLLLNLLTPVVYKILPNDYVRTGIILNNIKNSETTPDIVVFGNSRGMSGVNANILSDSTNYSVLNYCSPSQNLVESVLYYNRLPSSVKYIIQCIDEKTFNNDALKLTTAALSAFSMNNFEVNDFDRTILQRKDLDYLDTNILIKNFKSRSAYKTGISNLIVKLLDDDAPNDNIKDLRYPYMYPSDSSKTYERDLTQLLQWIPSKDTEFSSSESIINFFDYSYSYMENKGVKIIYVLMPNCPLLRWTEESNAKFRQMVKGVLESKELIDCYTLLEADDFYDPLHPNRKGGVKITEAIVKYIINNRL